MREGGSLGRFGIPYLVLFQVVLPLMAPLIDLFALYGLVFLDPKPVIGYWLAFNAAQLVLAAYAFRLDGESLHPLWALPLQQVRVPATDVPGRHPVGDQRRAGHPSSLAQARANGWGDGTGVTARRVA